MKDRLLQALIKAVNNIGIEAPSIQIDYPENHDHGDFSTNVALVSAKKLKASPQELAKKIIAEFEKDKPDFIDSISVAGPGFINFKMKDKIFAEEVIKVTENKEYGWSTTDKGKKVMVEYTDPNPFKIFHIGHLMSNAIGESISRLIQSSGAEVIRACYQGDVGLHVAKTIWAIQKKSASIEGTVEEKVRELGEMYIEGSKFDEDKEIQKEIVTINKKIFEKSDPEINNIYEEGRKVSLEYFDQIYEKLGTKFDKLFFESEVADAGVKIVKEFLKKGIFVESEGAIVFKGEDHGLHTRVFITSNGLPTYETKELGLTEKKFELYPDLTESIIVTANEQSDYFKVLLKALSLIDPKIAGKTKHMCHGILRFASGKMSSRKGNIVSAESLITDIKTLVMEKMSGRELSKAETDEIADAISIAAIKYTILRQSVGSDIIFDPSASVSFEGDSGPYLQYATVRAKSILAKGQKKTVSALPSKVGYLERLISRFPDTILRARNEYAPQYVTNYLTALASAFNSFYVAQVIIDERNPLSPYYLALTQAFLTTMTNGLWVLGIKVPEKM